MGVRGTSADFALGGWFNSRVDYCSVSESSCPLWCWRSVVKSKEITFNDVARVILTLAWNLQMETIISEKLRVMDFESDGYFETGRV